MVRRILLITFLLAWLLIMLLPSLAVVLARSGQVQLGRSDGRHVRLFLLQDAADEGLGLELAQPVSAPPHAPASASCLRTAVNYWIWRGEKAPGAAYCQCTDRATGESLPIAPATCLTP